MTQTIELDADTLDQVYRLMLRGLRETHPAETEAHRAFDTFLEEAGYPLWIGDQPEIIQQEWAEIIEQTDRNRSR